jgi:radical SAM superfamily enzyme YgiQ (UPF0313 family)
MSFEVGPIRPPSEARSLLVRVTRNCPWNRCAFCPVYKGAAFSIRKAEEVQQDIREMGRVAGLLVEISEQLGLGGTIDPTVIRAAARKPGLQSGFAQVGFFLAAGGERVFLQDANSLVMPADQLVQVLGTLHETFPTINRVTSYARAHTLTRRRPEQLRQLREAGLNRIHVGLESGSDAVLGLVRKGVDAARHVEAGRRVKAAGMELSEYLMPGLGGRGLWRQHAAESARVLSEIDPHFIRLRTTAIAPGTELERLVQQGKLEPMDDEEVVEEIKLFIERLESTAILRSDHILNLLPEIDGQLPEDKPRLLERIERFQSMEPRMRRAYTLGRRACLIAQLDDLDEPETLRRLLDLEREVEQRYGNDLQAAVRDLMTQFI